MLYAICSNFRSVVLNLDYVLESPGALRKDLNQYLCWGEDRSLYISKDFSVSIRQPSLGTTPSDYSQHRIQSIIASSKENTLLVVRLLFSHVILGKLLYLSGHPFSIIG